MSESLFLRIKCLNVRTMRGVTSAKQVIRVAALHNLRGLAAELGVNASSGIDPGRIALNYQLRGPDTAAGVADLAQALLDNAGVTKLRRDACMALEIVIGLPAASAINHREYFTAAVAWTDTFFNAPILSAAVHLDEAVGHMHVLVLPLVAGRMNGGALAGGPTKIRTMLADFQQKVGQRFGLIHQPRPKRLSKANRDEAGRMTLKAIAAHPECLNMPAVRDALVAALGQHHETLLPLLGLMLPVPKPKEKSFVQIMTAPAPEKKRGRQTSIYIHQEDSVNVFKKPLVDDEDRPPMYMLCKTSDFPSHVSPPAFEHPQATTTEPSSDSWPTNSNLLTSEQVSTPAPSAIPTAADGRAPDTGDKYKRQRDDDSPAEQWDSDRGEFVSQSHGGQLAHRARAASATPPGAQGARASPVNIPLSIHPLLALASFNECAPDTGQKARS